jgi:Protein of unknown function (DUF5818)
MPYCDTRIAATDSNSSHFSAMRLVHPDGVQAAKKIRFFGGGDMRHILVFSILLLGTTWMAAQNSTGTGQGSTTDQGAAQGSAGSQGGYGQGSAQAGAQTGNAQKTVTGCLSQANGQYMLTTNKGMTYQLAGDSSELANHVGHEIKVTGTESGAGASANAGGQMSANGPTLEVSSMKHISKTCKNAGATGNSSGTGDMSH